jgi:hypothetical protein
MANGNVLSLLDSAARAQAPIDGVSPASADGPDVATRADGLRFRIDFQAAATATQKTNAISAVLAVDLTDADALAARAAAKALLARMKDAEADVLRAIVLVTIDEINALRARLRAQDVAVAAAVSLADLKTRWAVLAAVPDRTGAQARAAVGAHLDDGSADS